MPKAGSGRVLVRTENSLVSAGTERMIVDFAEKSLFDKARSRPDLVAQTIEKAKREGILSTMEAVQNRLDQPMSLGYSCAGIVLESGVDSFQAGDRVACAGAGYAAHAEAVSVPGNLVVKLSDNVTFEGAAFTTLGAIALQGIRLSEAKLGEVVAVIGLGLLGQLAVQMLKAAGCIVIGMDIQASRTELAQRLGADAVSTSGEGLDALCRQFSAGHGADAVLITADTKSNQPVATAGEIARRKGIVVAVGAVGMTIPRKVYYEKEIDFRISCSYGPGRYDTLYEEKGQDYPYAYVRWTEQRNMQAFLQLLESKSIDVQPIISHRFPIADAVKAYDVITGKTGEPFLGVLMSYPGELDTSRKIELRPAAPVISQPGGADAGINLGVLGGGNFANATLLPALKKVPEINMTGIVSGSGLSARTTADRFGFSYCSTEFQQLLDDKAVNLITILTRHSLHARQVNAALQAGKHVFVEKPLCLNEVELQEIVETYRDVAAKGKAPLLMVGFNRRFAPFIVELKERLKQLQEPLMLNYRVNAGLIPPDHWTQDNEQGGGRLRGEGCHFIDLLFHLAGSKPRAVRTTALPDSGRYAQDNFVVTMEFENGSVGTVTYVANGDKNFSKEFLEVFGAGMSARMDDYRSLLVWHNGKKVGRIARLRQEKGHLEEWVGIKQHLTENAPPPISFDDVVTSTKATLAAYRSLKSGDAELVD